MYVMAGVYNYTWAQGEDLVLSLVYLDGPEGEEEPVDLSNYDLRMDISTPSGQRRYTLNSAVVEDLNPSSPNEEVDEITEATLNNEGKIEIRVPRSITLPEGELYDDIMGQRPVLSFNYDVFLRDKNSDLFDNGRQFKILKGQIVIERSVTLWK